MLLYSLVLFATTVIVCAQQQPYVEQDGVLIKPSKRRGCPLPPFPDNGEYQIKDPQQRLRTGSLVATGTILIYFCEESYEATSDRAVCLATGRWSANPVCHIRSQAPPCKLPPFPDNGTYNIQGAEKSSRVGEPVASFTLLEYACDEGFELSKNISICMGGIWSVDPECVAIVDTRCTLPPRPEYGTYQISPPGVFDTVTPGEFVSLFTILEYSCDYGYQPTKHITICLEEKKWSDLPECEPIPNFVYPNYTKNDGCGLPAMPDHGFYEVENYDRPLITGDRVVSYTVLNYGCEDNYVPTKMLSVCMQNQTWSANITCKKNCEMMTSDSVNFVCLTSDHKRVACEQFMPHESAVHSYCRAGYTPLDELEPVSCRDGEWDKKIPECVPDEGKPTSSWSFGIFQETRGNVLPMCIFVEGQVAIRVPQTIVQENNQQRFHANYYTFESGKFFKLPNNQLERDIFASSPVDTIQGVAKPGKDNKPKAQTKPDTTTINEIFPDSDPQQQVPSKCRQVCDDHQIFGDFVAFNLRNFNSEKSKKKLRLSIQKLIIEATQDDDYLSAVFNSATSKPDILDENGQEFDYIPDTDEAESPVIGMDVRFDPKN